MNKSNRSLVIALSFVLLAITISVAQISTAWEGTAFSASGAEIIASASAIKAKQYAAVTIFLEERHIAFDSTGKVASQTSRLVYRIESKDALTHWGTVAGTWSPWRQTRPGIKARVIGIDGTVATLDATLLTESAVHDQRPVIYEDRRSYSGPLPSVALGSVVEQEISWTDTAPLTAHGLQQRFQIGYSYPTLHTILELKAPSSINLQYKIRNGPTVVVTRSEKDGVVTTRFEQGALDGLDDAEPDLPSDVDRYPAILYSTGKSWNAVASGYFGDIETAIKPEDVQPLLTGTSGLHGDALLRRLLTNLNEKVRYTGLEFGSSALIPHASGEVVKTGYGDCKDKSVALVTALKALGIPANLVLLRTRGGDDIDPDLPGLGTFDHAIVRIPGNPATWIDTTAEFNTPGDLPWGDQGRYALVIDRGTQQLIRTPIQSAADNVLRSKREFFLSEYGAAHILETFEGLGHEDAILRSVYGQGETKDIRENLERYVKNIYLAEGLSRVDHGVGSDLTKSFTLQVEVAKGRRGSSDLNNAVAAIRFDGLLWGYPNHVLTDDGNDKPDQPGWKPRRHDIEIHPFSTEWTYKITPPVGFDNPVLPKDSETDLGPAKLTQRYAVEKDGTVTAFLKFDSGKARYTPAELKEFRLTEHALMQSNAIMIVFRQKGAALLAQGKAREALAVYSDLIKLHPSEALHHLQIASALLTAGFGEGARKEARRATELDPKSDLGWATLGWILEHDSIGRRFRADFDLDGAITAYRKAIELDPKNWTYRADLAILLEHDKYGERYSQDAKLDEAAAGYRALKEVNREKSEEYDNNLLFALFYARKWDEVLKLCGTLAPSGTRTTLKIASIAGRDGTQQAISEALRLESDEKTRSNSLVTAADILVRLRLYPLAVELLNAAVAGQEDSSKLRGRIGTLSGTRRYEEVLLPKSDPRSVVQKYFVYLLDPRADAADLYRFTAVDPADQKAEAEQSAHSARLLRNYLSNRDLPPTLARDLTISNLQMSVEGDDAGGFRIRAKGLGGRVQNVLIARMDGAYKIVAMDEVAMVGLEVLRRINTLDFTHAKQWLDWAREQQSSSQGDDPLAGRAFPRFWTRGDDPDPARMKLAALALLSDSSAIRPYIEFVKAERAHAQGVQATNLDLLLAQAARQLKDWKLLREAAGRLFDAYPASEKVIRHLTAVCLFSRDCEPVQRAMTARLARIPDDVEAVRTAAVIAEVKGDYGAARSTLRSLIDQNRAEMNDLNQYTWNALFLGKVSDEDLSLLQKAIAATPNSSYAEIHTLACLYAERGQTKEARELLIQAMDAAGFDMPNEAVWFGFGRIAEQYGLSEVALSIYSRVSGSEEPDYPSSTPTLARLREKRLKGSDGNVRAVHSSN